jgi:hypothetical protein
VKSGTLTAISLNPRLRSDYFAFRFYGWVNLPVDGLWRFYTTSDDGSKLAVGGTPVVDNDGGHAAQERSGTIAVQHGYHPLSVTYFEGNGSESLSVAYEGPGVSKRTLPATALVRVQPGLVDYGIEDDHLFLTYARPLIGTTGPFLVDTSGDLSSWSGDPADTEVGRTTSAFPVEQVTIRRLASIDQSPQAYLRLLTAQ